ncbi:MAG: hypothetical protein QNK05_08755 [Myxococcota bacterium]|nr:hypothetical protein [Myxococcota bacterium]
MAWPDPLHPAVVHLPIALALLVPIFAVSSVLQARLTGSAGRSWLVVVALQVLLVGSGWMAVETGEHEEERVEAVVAERPIEAHEEAGERFQLAGAAALVLIGAGLAPGRAGGAARGLALVATLVVLFLGIEAGRLGGELVYEHGAANAYVRGPHDLALGQEGEHHD